MLPGRLGDWVYQNLSVPFMLVGQVVWTIQSLFFNDFRFWPDLALDFAGLVLFLPGAYYSVNEFLRIEHESAPLFQRARAMMIGGFVESIGTASFSYLSSIVLRAFNWTLPYADSVRLVRLSLYLFGTLVVAIAVLQVRGRGPPAASAQQDASPEPRIRARWRAAVSLVGLVTAISGFFALATGHDTCARSPGAELHSSGGELNWSSAADRS